MGAMRGWRGGAVPAVLVAGGLVLTACTHSSTAATATTHRRPATTKLTAPSTTAASPGGTAPPTTHPTTTTTNPAVADITGFGATKAAWDAGHTPDPDAPKGSYWPRYANGEDTYQDVRFIRGRALSYVENVYPAETAAQVRAATGDEAVVVMRSPGAVFDPGDVTSLTYSAVPAR